MLGAALEQPRPPGDDLGMRFVKRLAGIALALGATLGLAGCEKPGSRKPERIVVTPRLVYYATDRVYLQRKLPEGVPNDLRLALVERSKQDLEVEGRLADEIAKSRRTEKVFEVHSEWVRPEPAGLQSWTVDLKPQGNLDPIGAVEAVEPLIWDTRAHRALRLHDVFTPAGLKTVAYEVCRAGREYRNCPDPQMMNLVLVGEGCPEKGYLINRIVGGRYARGRKAAFPPVQQRRPGELPTPFRSAVPDEVPRIPSVKESLSLTPARLRPGARDWSRFDIKTLVKPEYQWAFGQVEGCPPVI